MNKQGGTSRSRRSRREDPPSARHQKGHQQVRTIRAPRLVILFCFSLHFRAAKSTKSSDASPAPAPTPANSQKELIIFIFRFNVAQLSCLFFSTTKNLAPDYTTHVFNDQHSRSDNVTLFFPFVVCLSTRRPRFKYSVGWLVAYAACCPSTT